MYHRTIILQSEELKLDQIVILTTKIVTTLYIIQRSQNFNIYFTNFPTIKINKSISLPNSFKDVTKDQI